ncbi:penicillin-binding protein [Cellulosimicrobium terreum]|nr:penicillin-binding protein [Cellulosimicrobium terreum]
MARSTRTKGRTTARGRRRFFDYPRSRVTGFRRWLPSWRVVVGTMLGGIALVAGVLVAAYYTTDVPTALPDIDNQTTTVYWGDGSEMGKFAVENRELVEYDTLPEYVGNAVVASEDQTFWTNSGVDIKGIGRAFLNNVTGGDTQGASTLTQQYVERYYLDTTTDYVGKFKEAVLALKIGQEQDKEVVLGNYLNTIYFGRGAYGIQAAAQAYYGVDAKDLTASQSAMIAGIIPNPTNWDPAANLDQATHRWGRTLKQMYADGYVTKAEYDAATAEGFPEAKEYKKSNRYSGPTGYLLAMVRQELVDQGISEQDLDQKGYKVTTTIDPAMQKAAVAAAESVPRTEKDDANPASKNARVGLVSIDPADGSIRALYGGADYLEQSYNNSTMGAAQGGSTFKPFTLVAALEAGHTLEERFDGNSPRTFPDADNGEDWTVPNFGAGSGVSWGNIDLATATANSVNTVYAELNIEDGPEKTAEVAKRAGITSEVKNNAANVLGTATVKPLELANAYATFAAQGMKSTPHIVAKVEKLDGSLVSEGPGSDDRERVFEKDDMAAATYAMTQVVERGSGEPAKELGRPLAGKTGSSNENKSAWFAGYAPQLATVVGLYQSGEDGAQEQITPFGDWARAGETMTGGTWPVAAWTQYMGAAMDGMPVEDFPEYVPSQPVQTQEPQTQEPTEEPTTEEPTEEPTQEEPQNVTVPGDLVGRSVDDARAALGALGLRAQVTEEFSDQPRGIVISAGQAGAAVPPNSTIALVVSKGPDPATQPTEEPTEPTDPPTEPTDPPTDDGGGDDGGGDDGGGGNPGGGGGGGGNG